MENIWDRVEPLYEKTVRMYIVEGASQHMQAPHSANQDIRPLCIRILRQAHYSAGSQVSANSVMRPATERAIRIEVTDERDHTFLFLQEMTENDFQYLKRAQAILVDFAAFPAKLVDLVDQCRLEAREADDVVGSSFSARLELNTGVLSLIESNMFKQLTHISLQLRPGNDNVVKFYLSARLEIALNEIKRQNEQVRVLSTDLEISHEKNRKLNRDMTEFQYRQQSSIDSLQASHDVEISKFKLLNAQTIDELRQKYENQILELENSREDMKNQYANEVGSLEEVNRGLDANCKSLELRVKELTQQLQLVENERNRIQHDSERFSHDSVSLLEAKNKLEREVSRYEAQVEGLSRQLLDKEETNAKTISLLHSVEESRDMLKQQLSSIARTNEDLQDKLKDCTSELRQRNQDVHRSLNEYKELKSRLATKSEVIRRQEKLVEQLRSKLLDNERDLRSMNDEIKSLSHKHSSVQRELEDAKDTIRQKDVTIENDKQVIAYLNEEQSKWQLGIINSAPATGNISFPNPIKSQNISFSPDSAARKDSQYRSPGTYANEKGPILHRVTPSYVESDQQVLAKGLANLGLAGKIHEFHIDSLDEIKLFPTESNTSQRRNRSSLNDLEYYATAEKVSQPLNDPPRKGYVWESPEWLDTAINTGLS